MNATFKSCDHPSRRVTLKFSSKIGIKINPINIGTVGISHFIIIWPITPKQKTNWISNNEPLSA